MNHPAAQSSAYNIRDAHAGDFDTVLRLNREWEHVTSPLDATALEKLHEWAACHRVVETDAGVSAFLIAVGPGTPYGSVNYRWFDERLADFLYIDRVVVDASLHRSGFGGALYRDVREIAVRSGFARLVCEVDIEPLNRPSDEFHTRFGFVEVGTQLIGSGAKRVSLRECAVGA